MTKEQLEFCAQIELTRGLKQAKLTEKVAFLTPGTKVYILASSKTGKRIKFASMEHGLRGWAPVSKFAFLAKEGEMRKHNDHIDNTYGNNGKEILVDCPNGSGNMVWLPMGELLPINPPPATPEALNPDLGAESEVKCPKCKGEGRPGCGSCPECGGYATEMKERKESTKDCPDCQGTFQGAEGETCPTCGRFAVQKEALKPALPPMIPNQRMDVNASGCDSCDAAMINGVFCHETGCPKAPRKCRHGKISDSCSVCSDPFEGEGSELESSLHKTARVVHHKDGWHVLSEKGKNLGGPYKSKAEAVKRLRQVEYFKHNGALRPFSKKVIAEIMVDPYQSLTDHIMDMRTRMDQVQEKIQTVPTVKTAEDKAPEMDLPTLFADITQGIDLLEDKLGGDAIEPELHSGVEELENRLWKLEEACGITPKLSEHEKEEPEHKEVVEDIEKKEEPKEVEASAIYCKNPDCKCKATVRRPDGNWCEKHAPAMSEKKADLPGLDPQKTPFDQKPYLHRPRNKTLNRILEDVKKQDVEFAAPEETDLEAAATPDLINSPSFNPNTPAPLGTQNVQPTDDDNLEVPVPMPTSPPAPGQKWVYNSVDKAYVSMPDSTDPSKLV